MSSKHILCIVYFKEQRNSPHYCPSLLPKLTLDEYNKDQYRKKLDDETRMRGVVCKLNWNIKRRLSDPNSKDRRQEANLRRHLLENRLKKERRQDLLRMMEKEATNWLYYENVDAALKNSVLIPDNLHYQTDYFVKLQEKASLVAEGLYEEVEDYQSDQRVLQFKNSKLIPIYANITGILSHLKQNEVERLYEEYEIALYGLKEVDITDQEKKQTSDELGTLYDQLITKVRRDMNKPKKKLQILEEKLLYVYNLLLMWRQYTELMNLRFEKVLEMMGQEPRE